VPLSMCNWRDSVDDTRGCLWTPSQAEPNQYSRSYWGPAVKRWTLREVSMNGGRAGAEPQAKNSARLPRLSVSVEIADELS
jgi:hypothetical protein